MEETNSQEVAAIKVDLDIFDPKKEGLQEIADEVSKIEADPTKMDKDTLVLVNATKNKLVKARTTIEKAGKAARDPHTQYNKKIKAYEDELIAIIEPEEKRLAAIEKDAKKIAVREARRETLPEYKEKLMSINGKMPNVTDEELLDMDPTKFQEFYNDCREEHFDTVEREKEESDAKEAAEKEAEQKKIDDEKADLERQKEALALERVNNRFQKLLSIGFKIHGLDCAFGKEGCEIDILVDLDNIKELNDESFNELYVKVFDDVNSIKARWEKEKSEQIAKEKSDAVEQAKQEAADKAKQEKADEEAKRLADEKAESEAKEAAAKKVEEDKEAREKAEGYQNWLKDNSYNPDTDNLNEVSPGKWIMYRKVSSYTELGN